MLDPLPDERRVQQVVAAALEAHIAAYGYRAVELPVLEQTELYLCKVGQRWPAGCPRLPPSQPRPLPAAGADGLGRAGVKAAYFQNASLPLRLAYSGPVFRYETPGRGRYRQFIEVGVERPALGRWPPTPR